MATSCMGHINIGSARSGETETKSVVRLLELTRIFPNAFPPLLGLGPAVPGFGVAVLVARADGAPARPSISSS